MTGGAEAFVDESGSIASLDPNCYMITAVIFTSADAMDVARMELWRIQLSHDRGSKVHWHNRTPKQRMAPVETVAALDAPSVIVVRTGHPSDPSERQRRKCLDRLIPELAGRDVRKMTAESRGKKDDKRDVDAIQNMRARLLLTGHLRLDHCAGPAEPLLWAADIVCGALTQDRCGNGSYLARLSSSVTVIEISAD